MKTTFTSDATRDALARLSQANQRFMKAYPGEGSGRQAVHTVYGGAQLFTAETARKMGEVALRSLAEYAPDGASLAEAVGLPSAPGLAEKVYARVVEKLRREPVEDFRIDFEDGYGNRPDPEEDAAAESAAREVAKGRAAKSLSPFIGIRIKPFTEELRDRSVRTLDIFLSTLLEATGGTMPDGFFVTLPKVTIPEQVTALADLLDLFEDRNRLPRGTVRFEIMVETTQSLISSGGVVILPLLVLAGRGRCVAAHFGTYDYTACCAITAAHQHMAHPACDFAKDMMQVSLAGTGVLLSDGATNIMPVGPHRAAKGGPPLTPAQVAENRRVVHAAWRLHYGHVRHSLETAYYQGWDLHPAQLPTRYAAVYAFFLEALPAASERLKNFISKAAQATLVGDVFDDAATGQGLLNFFLRGINCGAIQEEEALATGITIDELRGRSFVKILKNRRG